MYIRELHNTPAQGWGGGSGEDHPTPERVGGPIRAAPWGLSACPRASPGPQLTSVLAGGLGASGLATSPYESQRAPVCDSFSTLRLTLMFDITLGTWSRQTGRPCIPQPLPCCPVFSPNNSQVTTCPSNSKHSHLGLGSDCRWGRSSCPSQPQHQIENLFHPPSKLQL